MIRYLRVLPAVVIVGIGLLAIKGVDLAQASPDPYAEPDNSGLAPSLHAPATPDFASDTAIPASAAEADVTSSLARRRAELDARERGLNMRENILSAGEARVDQKIAALKQLQAEMQGLLAQRDAKQDQQIASLVKTYSAMKPKDAARIFNSLNDEVLLPVAKGMKSDVLAPVMAAMVPEAAQRLTVHLAALLKLPDAPSACPNLAAPPPGTQADARPLPPDANPVVTPDVPLQTSALAPSPVVTPVAPATPATLPTPPAANPAGEPPTKPHTVAVHRAPTVKLTTSAPPPKPVTAAAPAKPDATSNKPATAAAATQVATPPPAKSAAAGIPANPSVVAPTTAVAAPAALPTAQAASVPPAPVTPAAPVVPTAPAPTHG